LWKRSVIADLTFNYRLFIGHPITATPHTAPEKRSVIADLKHAAGPPFL
jgi:hypothetical protein